MKKKFLISLMCVLTLVTVILAGGGCTPKIDITKADENVIGVLQKAIAESVKAETYFIKQKEKKEEKMTEYKFTLEKEESGRKAKFEIIHTKGISSYSDTFIFGKSLPSGISANKATESDYKSYVFSQFKKSDTAPKNSKLSAEIDLNDIEKFVTATGVSVGNFTMTAVLNPLKELTVDDMVFDKDTEKGNFKKGKVSNFAFKVKKEGHIYKDKGVINVQIMDGKVMRIMSADEAFTLDTMYKGAKIVVPNYDTFSESGIEIEVASDRTDGMIAVYETEDYSSMKAELINPNEATFKLVDSVVNYNNTFTEVICTYTKDGEEVSEHVFILSKNIVDNSFDIGGLLPYAGIALGAIALIVALLALIKLRKSNKLLTKKINLLSGNGDEAEEHKIAVTAVESAEDNANEVADNEINDINSK